MTFTQPIIFAVFFVQTVCDGFLKRLQRADFNPFHQSLANQDPLLAYKLLWNSFFKGF